MGIEPTYPAWKAGVLPMNYTRTCDFKSIANIFSFVNIFFRNFLFFYEILLFSFKVYYSRQKDKYSSVLVLIIIFNNLHVFSKSVLSITSQDE